MAEIDHHDEQPPTLAPPVAASAPSPEDPEAPPPEEPTLVAENGHSNAQERDGDEFESDGTRTAVPAAADAAVENGDELERAETADQHSPRPVSKDFGSVPPPPPKLAVIPADEDAASELSDEPGAREVRSTSLTSDGTFEDVALSRSSSASPALPDVPDRELSPPPPPPPSHSPAPPAAPANGSVAAAAPAAPVPSVSSHSSSMSRSTTSSSLNGNGNGNGSGAGRRSSVGSTTTVSAPGSSTLVSGILIVSALESIAASKEAKKSKPLKDAVDRALDALKHLTPTSASAAAGSVDPHLIFAPLQLACETKSLPLMITALDCIGKLLSYDFFVDRNPPRNVPDAAANDDGEGPTPAVPDGEQASFADLITATVCDCFSPSPVSTSSNAAANAATTQHDTLLLRLLSCLLSLILSPALSVHQSSLLKAVRTVYNIFLMGRAGMVQTVAQATLGQIVSGVFSRVSVGEAAEAAMTANGNGNGYGSASGSAQHSRAGSVSGSAAASRVDLGTVDKPTLVESQNGDHADQPAPSAEIGRAHV